MCIFIVFLVVEVAWEQTMYFVNENDLYLMACAIVTNGTLCRDIELLVSTDSSTISPQATGESASVTITVG